MGATANRWAWAEIDVDAVEHNVALMRRTVAPAQVWVVVKADAYGHGAATVARAALRAGAAGLCVALVQEGIALREAGIGAPILVLSEQPPELAGALVQHRLAATVYTPEAISALVGAGAHDHPVHVKVDSGMQRVGAAPDAVPDVIRLVDATAGLSLAGVWTHLANADVPEHPGNGDQLSRFDEVLTTVDYERGGLPAVHAANSAAALAFRSARRSFVRMGIVTYGISPGHGVDDLAEGFRPVMTLKARVSHVKRVTGGTSISYGWRHRFDRDTTVATLPIGYADGVARRMGTLPDRAGAEVLIGGRRCPIVGVVTMDQLMVDVGDADVAVGDEAVLIGAQGGERIRVEDWADRLGTIGYEITCGITARVPRVDVERA